jgi:hypothetical protein
MKKPLSPSISVRKIEGDSAKTSPPGIFKPQRNQVTIQKRNLPCFEGAQGVYVLKIIFANIPSCVSKNFQLRSRIKVAKGLPASFFLPLIFLCVGHLPPTLR